MTKKYQQSESYIARESEALGDVQKIRFFPFVGAEGKGVRLCDLDGNEYLDFTASGGVIAAGYGHPRIREAIIAELDHSRANMHCILPHPLVVELGERLVARMPGDFPKKAWFGATGSDANDCLAKLVPPAAGRRRMICYVGGYHGSTLGSAAITGHKAHAKVISGGNVTKVPYPYCYRCLLGYDDPETCSLQCLKFLEDYALSAVSPADDTAAIIMEVIQSDGGEIVPPPNYIPALRELCDKYGIWLLFDEIKTGLGRTGKYFAFEHYDISADGISLAKPLGGGLPLSAVLARQEILDQSIFNLYGLGGAPVPCAAALATLQVIEEEGLTDNAAAMGDRLLEGLKAFQRRHHLIGDVRGKGLMVGVELVSDRATKEPATQDTARVIYRCFELGLLMVYTGALGNVIEITPPLVINEQELDEGLSIFDQALSDVEAGRFDDQKLAPYSGGGDLGW